MMHREGEKELCFGKFYFFGLAYYYYLFFSSFTFLFCFFFWFVFFAGMVTCWFAGAAPYHWQWETSAGRLPRPPPAPDRSPRCYTHTDTHSWTYFIHMCTSGLVSALCEVFSTVWWWSFYRWWIWWRWRPSGSFPSRRLLLLHHHHLRRMSRRKRWSFLHPSGPRAMRNLNNGSHTISTVN